VNKKELVDQIAERTDFPPSVVAEVVDAFISETTSAVVRGEKVTLSGFGTFFRQARAQRTARNIWTGEAVTVRARDIPAFRAGKPFQEAVTRRRRARAGTSKAKSTRARSRR
jgi:DNA-binding protein HU-beta